MNFLGKLALLFVIIPILELVLLVQVGQVVGLLPTLLLVVTTGVGGAMLARAEGMRVLFQFQRELASGHLPGQALLDGISVLIGGAFLLTPGVITDLFGLSLLFPPSRRWIQARVRARLEEQIANGSIQVIKGAGGRFGFGGFSASAGFDPTTNGPTGSDDDPSNEALDPSKGIVVEPNDSSRPRHG